MDLRMVFFLLLLTCTVFPNVEMVQIVEERSFGDEALPEFLYSINVDCSNKLIIQEIFDQDVNPVQGAKSYLKYHQYSSPLLSSKISGEEGGVVHSLPGDPKKMTHLFVIVIEKSGFRKKEVHFDIRICVESDEDLDDQDDAETSSNDTSIPEDEILPEDGETEIPEEEVIPEESTTPEDGGEGIDQLEQQEDSDEVEEEPEDILPENDSLETEEPEAAADIACPLPFILLALLFARVV